MKKILNKILILCICVLTIFSLTACEFILDDRAKSPQNSTYGESSELIDSITFKTLADSERAVLSKADVYEKYSQSVVAIVTAEGSAGSGVIVDIDNANFNETEHNFYLITCHHVIESASRLTVYVPDASGKNYNDTGYNSADYAFTGNIGGPVSLTSSVRLIGGDKQSDLAVLGLYVQNTVVANDIAENKAKVMAKSNKLRVLDEVIAIGNPLGVLPGTGLSGEVSYINRPATFPGIGTISCLQIDVPITHGSSGGALFNTYGELVGITNGGSESYTACNYAIPLYVSETETKQGVVPIISQLIATSTNSNYGYVSGRWMLGITVSEVTVAGYNTYTKITGVENYSPASIAGLQAEDIILSVSYSGQKKSITDVDSLDNAMSDMRSKLTLGSAVEFSIQRNGSTQKINLTLAQYIFRNTGL